MLDISKYDAKALKTEAAIIKVAAEIGTGNLTDISVFERFSTFMYAVGVAHRLNKVNGDINTAAIFEAFDTPFRSGEGSVRVALKDASIKTWVSAFGSFAEAGQFTAYDMAPIVEGVQKLAKQSYTVRGSKLRKVMEKFPKVAPTEVELDAILNPVAKPVENPALKLAKRWQSACSDDRLAKSKDADDKATLDAIKANANQRIAMIAVQKSIDAFVAACEASKGESGMSKDDELAMLRAKLAGTTPTPTVN